MSVMLKFSLSIVAFLTGVTPALADRIFVDRVTEELVSRGWDERKAAAVSGAQELSFALHDANGTLDLRLNTLGRFSGDDRLQLLVARHPALMDFFLSLENTRDFSDALDRFSQDQRRRETLLEAMLAHPDRAGYRQFEHVVSDYAAVLTHLADVPEFGTLVSELVVLKRDGATSDFEKWLAELLQNSNPEEVEAITLLLAMHGGLLRKEWSISARWEILNRATSGNPDLRELLLSHLGVWRHLDDEALIDIIKVQLSNYGRDHAQLYLVFLLGSDGFLESASLPDRWQEPLSEDRLNWAIHILKDNPTSPAIEAALYFRQDPVFWDFAVKSGIAERIPCLLSQEGKGMEGLAGYFSYDAKQIDGICGGTIPDWLPLSGIEGLVRKGWYGTPIEAGDLGWAALDVIDSALTLSAFGAGKSVVPVAKSAILTSRMLRAGKGTSSLIRGEKVLSSAVKASVLEANTARRAVAGSSPGLSRMLGLPVAAMITRAAKARRLVPTALAGPLRELADTIGYGAGEELLDNLLTTEFIRCSGFETITVDDAICQALFSPATQDEVAQ